MKTVHTLYGFVLFTALLFVLPSLTAAFISAGSPIAVTGVANAQNVDTCRVAPLAKTPEDKVGTANPTYTWQAVQGCTDYQVYLATDAAILSITWVSAEEASCSGGLGNCTYSQERTLPEGDYGWWVRGWQPREGTSRWSSGTRFTIDMDICAKLPQPVAPADEIMNATPVFQWRGVYGCEWYQLSASGAGGNVVSTWINAEEINCALDAVCSFSPDITLPVGSYFWWIRGWSRGTRIGQWTSAMPFTVVEADTTSLPTEPER